MRASEVLTPEASPPLPSSQPSPSFGSAETSWSMVSGEERLPRRRWRSVDRRAVWVTGGRNSHHLLFGRPSRDNDDNRWSERDVVTGALSQMARNYDSPI